MLTRNLSNYAHTLGGYMIVPSPSTSAALDKRELNLQVECDQGRCLLGERLFVRCSVINHTAEPITITYGPSDSQNGIGFEVADDTGELVSQFFFPHGDGYVPFPVTIEPGKRLVATVDLFSYYALVEPGKYRVTAVFRSGGKFLEYEEATQKRQPRTAWNGELRADVGNITLLNPNTAQDAAAYKILVDTTNKRSNARHFGLYMSTNDDNLAKIADEYPYSRYAPYARCRLGLSRLPQFGRQMSIDFPKEALAHLNAIDEKGFPKLFQEYVQFHRIEAHLAVGTEKKRVENLIAQFRESFPESPVISLLDELVERASGVPAAEEQDLAAAKTARERDRALVEALRARIQRAREARAKSQMENCE